MESVSVDSEETADSDEEDEEEDKLRSYRRRWRLVEWCLPERDFDLRDRAWEDSVDSVRSLELERDRLREYRPCSSKWPWR